jgi:hypothetical protein
MADFGITDQGFTLKRLSDILADISSDLNGVIDPVSGEGLIFDLADENDPLVNIANSVGDQLSVCWEQLQLAYNQFDPLKATGVSLAGLVQLNGMLKRLGEDDTTLRVRQQAETALTSYRQVESIYSAIIDVVGVQFARIYQNSTLVPFDDRGIPAKSLSAVVYGGDDTAIGQVIFDRAPIGLGYFGDTEVTATDNQGFNYKVLFQRPVLVPIFITVNVVVLDDLQWPTNGVELIKAALVASASYGLDPHIGLPPGVAVVPSRLYTPANTIPGHEITTLVAARGANPQTINPVVIAWNEVAQILIENITVNIA